MGAPHLPYPPAEVVRLQHVWTLDADQFTTGLWLFVPGLALPLPGDMNALLGDYVFTVLPDWLSAMASDISCSLLRLSTYGSAPAVYELAPPANHGDIPGPTAPANAAGVFSLIDNRSHGGKTHCFLPLPAAFVDVDAKHLSTAGAGTLQIAADDILSDVATLTAPGGDNLSVIALHRSQNGEALAAAVVVPVYAARVNPRIGRCSRRLRSRS